MPAVNRLATAIALSAIVSILAACSDAEEPVEVPTPEASAVVEEAPARTEGRHLTALVGGGQDTISLNAFFPSTIRIRAGDTVTWNLNSDEVRTVSFLAGEQVPSIPARADLVPVPGSTNGEMMLNPWSNLPTRAPGEPVETYDGSTFVSSGIMSKDPIAPGFDPNDTFTVRFDVPGIYEFADLNHLTPRGSVVVVNGTDDVDDQAAIDARAAKEMQPLAEFAQQMRDATSILGDIRHLSSNYLFSDEFLEALGPYAVENFDGEIIYREPLSDGSDLWLVQAALGPEDSKLLEFIPKELTVRAGDTVSWNFPTAGHSVVFDPVAPHPELVKDVVGDEWPPSLIVDPDVAKPIVPSFIFDPTQYYTSGLMGFDGAPGGKEVQLKFTQVGVFDYFCAVHRELGMEGTIRVIQYTDDE